LENPQRRRYRVDFNQNVPSAPAVVLAHFGFTKVSTESLKVTARTVWLIDRNRPIEIMIEFLFNALRLVEFPRPFQPQDCALAKPEPVRPPLFLTFASYRQRCGKRVHRCINPQVTSVRISPSCNLRDSPM
jgi:hypothetical protein